MTTTFRRCGWYAVAFALLLLSVSLPKTASAQDPDDPPGRVARLGYMDGSVSFQPAGEDDWVGAVPNRPMTTGDKLWTDRDSRAEVQLGSAVIRLAPMTGFSFLNLDDSTIQIQLTSGAASITVRRIGEDDYFEVDTPNLAFTIFQPGHYRIEASEDGNNTNINVREGEGEANGGGQDFTLRGGQSGYFSGTDSLYADVEQIGPPDQFDSWSEMRDHRYDYSRSAQYMSRDVVGFDDLDDYGDWRDDGQYGHVWFPNRVDAGWAPYHEGHWDWISPWGWTWVDDSPWGYAPFHYGRWVSVGGRWGWVAGPAAVRPVYAPALVVFVGGGPGGFGGNVGWFPLGPREVYVPSYHVSEAYVNRVNVSSTTVTVTQVTNVYHTTIINNSTTNITNITYANRSVQGAVMVVPQHAFTSAQPVASARVTMTAQQIASAPMSGRVAVAPTRESVLGSKAATAGHVTAPPVAVANRQVVAKRTPPPPPVAFAKQQQALAAHPGQPLARSEVAKIAPPAAARPAVRVAPPAKPATPNTGHPPANAMRPGQPAGAPANQPAANERPAAQPAQPNRPAPAQPNARPEPTPPANRPAEAPARSNQPPAAQPNRPETNRPAETPARPPAAQQNNRPENNRPANQPNRPEANKPVEAPPKNDRPPAAEPNNRPAPERNEPAQKPQPAPQNARPQERTPPPAAAKPAAPAPKQQPKPLTPEEKKKQQEEQKKPGQ
jgi:hypothetical protein